MLAWVQECPSCGYVARQLSDAPKNVTKEYLQSAAYKNCDGLHFTSDLAARFYRESKNYLLNGDILQAYLSLVKAAWACDDDKDEHNAVQCRIAAVSMANECLATPLTDQVKEGILRQKADLLRRSGQFERLIAEYSDVTLTEEINNTVLKFELYCADRKDTACYTLQDAVEYGEKNSQESLREDSLRAGE